MARTDRTSTADWQTIDPASLTGDAADLYAAYKAAYKAAREARELFEAEMTELCDVPTGQRLVFGYNFGKLSVALVPDDRKPIKSSGGQTLSSFLASTQASGRRT